MMSSGFLSEKNNLEKYTKRWLLGDISIIKSFVHNYTIKNDSAVNMLQVFIKSAAMLVEF